MPHHTPRLAYVIDTLFRVWLNLPYRIVTPSEWQNVPPPSGWRVISYGTDDSGPADISLPYTGFLSWTGTAFFLPAWDAGGFFPSAGDFRWDLPAMAFYVLTLYPLYRWPYGWGQWGLYAWEKAPFYKAPFWAEPFVQCRLYELLQRLELRIRRPPFRWEIGWDIDHLYKWKARGGLRWWVGGLRRGDLLQRLRVRWGNQKDPYDTLDQITAAFPPSSARFFFLLSNRHWRDSLVSPYQPAVRQAIQRLHARGYSIGLHPSYTTRQRPERLLAEKALLESYLGAPVKTSRQHYLRFFWPDLLEALVQARIEVDFTLAFPRRSGFLLGTLLEVPAYRVDKDRGLPLRLCGPALMDKVYLQQNDDGTALRAEVRRLFRLGAQLGGRLHFIWHNSTWEFLPAEFLEAQP
ncbi:MAG: hypothetical protein NZ958_01435 [Bacteroidia bacterium]|nr:hypothetical protein [Bacteroidia bacterium]MDW8089327.1 hypothetical protein [Bacteroidia bacterium]